jgi:hypothetical protein
MDANEGTAGWWVEETLMDRLGSTFAIMDPAPPGLLETACQVFAWRTIDADLAELLRAGLAHAPAD